jgi:hypothetical protein
MPKTGTTSLQRALSKSAVSLLRSGVSYPLEFCNSSGLAHHPIAHEIAGRGEPSTVLSDFQSFLSRNAGGNVLISSEAFTNCLDELRLPRMLSFLRSCKTTHTLRGVMALRRTDSFMESMYLHSLKAGEIHTSFSQYVLQRRHWSANLLKSLVALRDEHVFDELEFVKYGGSDGFGDEVVRALGLNGIKEVVSPIQPENRKLGLRAQIFLKYLGSIEQERNLKFRRWYLVRAFDSGALAFPDDNDNYSVMSEYERLFLHEVSLRASLQFGFPEYFEFFGDDVPESLPLFELDRAILLPEDIERVIEFQNRRPHRQERAREKIKQSVTGPEGAAKRVRRAQRG